MKKFQATISIALMMAMTAGIAGCNAKPAQTSLPTAVTESRETTTATTTEETTTEETTTEETTEEPPTGETKRHPHPYLIPMPRPRSRISTRGASR